MPELKHSKSTDSEHKIKLESSLVYATWGSGAAIAGTEAGIEVGTAFVGNGAPVKITGKSSGGKKLWKLSDTINGNSFRKKVEIPEDLDKGDQLYFEVKLPRNGLKGKSNSIPLFPRPVISNMKWSSDQARRGDLLTLTADIDKVDSGTEVLVTIYEYDRDSAHDKITELPAMVEKGKIELKWEYEYTEDVDEIPTEEELSEYGESYNPPEYFFTVKFMNYEYGLEQQSGLLTFKDYLEIELADEYGNKSADEKYKIIFPDGSEKEGTLDENGYAKIEDIPPGRVSIEFPDLDTAEIEPEE
ncbi:MAG: hypothetical protein GF417_07000 [Candidatus Latescibacteria bacterium]|nr:hypothetical protein [bacterium]MBD3424167.1 hypothetical protein [Candidatus Latescibacterota bacterium]